MGEEAKRLEKLIQEMHELYEILQLFNTPERIVHIITQIEYREFKEKLEQTSPDHPEVLDEIGDLGVFPLKLLYLLNASLIDIITSIQASPAPTVEEAKSNIESAVQKVASVDMGSREDMLQRSLLFLSSIATYCETIGLSWIQVVITKLEYSMLSMSPEVWSVDYINQVHGKVERTPDELFKLARPISKSIQNDQFPKETYLIPRFEVFLGTRPART